MVNALYNMNNYSGIFASPIGSNRVSSMTNFLYGASITANYSSRLSHAVKSQMSSFLSTLNSDMKDLKSSAKTLIADDKNTTSNLKKVEPQKDIDKSAVLGHIKDFVEDFNNNLSDLKNSYYFKGAQDLNEEFAKLAKSKEMSLSYIGIDVGENGELEIDEEKLEEKLETSYDRVMDVMGGDNGLAGRTLAKTEKVLSSPQSKYLTPADMRKNDIIYNNKANTSRSLYNQNMYRGMMINLML